MRITDVKVFGLEWSPRSGLALYEIQRGGLEPEQVTPYRQLDPDKVVKRTDL